MSTLVIEGGHRLEGRVAVEGNKNAALPLLAACLLTSEECVLTNVPRIGDVNVMVQLLLDVGASVEGIGTTTLRIRTPEVRTHVPDRALVGRLRGSVLLLGPLLARTGRAQIAPPGGDFPARRSIAIHLDALLALGARQRHGADHVLEAPEGLKGASMYLYEASVTGTETALLAAAAAEGVTEIRHAATEPHVVELCEFLRKMGAGVTGIGSSRIRVEGVPRLGGATHRLGGDYIEAGSWAVVGAITGGEIDIEGAREEDMEVVAAVMNRMNVSCGMNDGVFQVKPSKQSGGLPPDCGRRFQATS
jgi:UDP-N-acetylglucosamine 1-carboxyvinyltransferase